jgi:hypothetical protein
MGIDEIIRFSSIKLSATQLLKPFHRKKLENYLSKQTNETTPFNPKLSDLVEMEPQDLSSKGDIESTPRPRKNSFKIFHDDLNDKNTAKLANLRRKISLDMDLNYKIEKKLKAE